jgi:hypothetical protein
VSEPYPFTVVPYDPGQHAEFVYSEVRRCASKFPYALPGATPALTQRWLAESVRRAHARNPRGCLVAMDLEEPEVALSVLISPGPQAVTWCYTKYPVRRRRYASRLCEMAGIDLSQTVSVTIWTAAASRILASGYRLVPEVWEWSER